MLRPFVLAALFASATICACAQATTTPAASPSSLPYSPVIVSGDTIFLVGHLGRLPGTSEYPEGGIGPQTTQTLENIGATLATVGATHADLVRCQVFLADIADFAEMNTAYRVFFPNNPPARTTVAVSGLAANASIEIECTGRVGHGRTKAAFAPRPGPGSHEMLRAATSASADHNVIITDVVLPPAGQVSRHSHPTEEHLYVLEGTTLLIEAGKPNRSVSAGQSYTIPANTEHEATAGTAGLRAIVVRVQPNGQPERIAAKD